MSLKFSLICNYYRSLKWYQNYKLETEMCAELFAIIHTVPL